MRITRGGVLIGVLSAILAVLVVPLLQSDPEREILQALAEFQQQSPFPNTLMTGTSGIYTSHDAFWLDGGELREQVARARRHLRPPEWVEAPSRGSAGGTTFTRYDLPAMRRHLMRTPMRDLARRRWPERVWRVIFLSGRGGVTVQVKRVEWH